MVTMSEEIGKLATALVKAQAEVESALKFSTNPHFSAPYADLTSVLTAIKPALAKHGLAMVQYPGYGGDVVTMITVLVHESGEWLQSPVASIPITKKDPHGAMSGITYLRRGCASSLMALIADEDDDGNAAVGPKPTKQTKPTVDFAKMDEAMKAQKATLNKQYLAERLDTLGALIDACEQHGGVDAKGLKAAQTVVAAEGPLERVEQAIKFLEKEIGR
jgi:hypothetical protein